MRLRVLLGAQGRGESRGAVAVLASPLPAPRPGDPSLTFSFAEGACSSPVNARACTVVGVGQRRVGTGWGLPSPLGICPSVQAPAMTQ